MMASRILSGLLLTAGWGIARVDAQIQVVTTIFPLTDWARAVGGDRVTVRQLLPPGVEAHAFAPKPSDVLALNRADVFIYLGENMEPWAEDLLRGLDSHRLVVIKAGRDAMREDENGEKHRHGHGDTDPHVWLDPVLAQAVVSSIAEGLAQADSEGREMYLARAAEYLASLQALHERIAAGLAHCRHRRILYGGHFAFGYFARRYELTHLSPYAGFSPSASPTPAQISALIRTIRASGQTTLFYEELLDPKVGRIIAEETGARLVMLHGAHNLSREEHARGDVTYLSIMEDNLSKLRVALGCE
ncbi:MAG: zinc ABC transporter substrate-binding protein [Verrucomicrobia bacterium]|nr:zinc ABC transporter substrate-binding protein [Verrucomicrobiota bacterium]MBU1908791.1 zinc ABC transporter substrate-binding protein [Verrucomicrobiota bacterium]